MKAISELVMSRWIEPVFGEDVLTDVWLKRNDDWVSSSKCRIQKKVNQSSVLSESFEGEVERGKSAKGGNLEVETQL